MGATCAAGSPWSTSGKRGGRRHSAHIAASRACRRQRPAGHSFLLSACVRLYFPCATAHYIVRSNITFMGNLRSPAIRAAPAGPVCGSAPATARPAHCGSTSARARTAAGCPCRLDTSTTRYQAVCQQGLRGVSLHRGCCQLALTNRRHRCRHHCHCHCRWRRAGRDCSAQDKGRDRLRIRRACRHD